MDPLQILQMLMAQGQSPSLPRTPIPSEGLPPITPPPTPAPEPKVEAPQSEFEKMMAAMKAEGAERPRASGGAASLNPFYNPSSSGMGTETFTKMASAIGGK